MSNQPIPQSNRNIQSSPHLLSLKVLRAARPNFKHNQLHPSINPITPDSNQSPIRFEPIPSTSTLTLPDSFGVIYLGQTFHGLLSVQYEGNQSDSAVENATLKAELHTAAHKVLLDEVGPCRVGFGENGLELSVKQEIKELGLHTLVCTVSYDQIEPVNSQDLDPASSSPNPNGRISRNFRKLYKFQVSNPLSVKTKVLVPTSTQPSSQSGPSPSTINAIFSPTIRHQLYLEVQIQNQSVQPIIFQHVKLIPPHPEADADAEETLEYVDMNLDGSTNLLPTSMTRLSIGDANQFLFLVIQSAHPSPNKSIQVLGRLDISWYSTMGEPGRLMTNALTRKLLPPPLPSIPTWPTDKALNRFGSLKAELIVESLDYSNIIVGKPFTVRYLIKLPDLPKISYASFVLVLQHLPFDDQSIELDDRRTILPTPSSNPDWSLKDSLVSLSSSLLSSNSTKRSSTIETMSANKSTWNEPQNRNRWTIDGNLKASPPISTPRPMIRNEEIRTDHVGIIRLGPEKIRLSEVGLENRVTVDYLALEPGLKALGGFRLIIEGLKDDGDGDGDEVEGYREVVVGEWNETSYVWCKL